MPFTECPRCGGKAEVTHLTDGIWKYRSLAPTAANVAESCVLCGGPYRAKDQTPETPPPEVKAWGVGMPALLYLHEFGNKVQLAFGGRRCFLVGSALREKAKPRDVDVRLVLPYAEFEARVAPLYECNMHLTGWAAVCEAWSALGEKMTGLPIDFQIYPTILAKPYQNEPRIPLGAGHPYDPTMPSDDEETKTATTDTTTATPSPRLTDEDRDRARPRTA